MLWFITKKSNSIPGGASKQNSTPLRVLFCLVLILSQSKRRFSVGSMRVDSGVNEAPVGLQSRIVTEPEGASASSISTPYGCCSV